MIQGLIFEDEMTTEEICDLASSNLEETATELERLSIELRADIDVE